MLKVFEYQICVARAGVIKISFGSFSLSVLLRTFEIMQNAGKAFRNLCAQFCLNAPVL